MLLHLLSPEQDAQPPTRKLRARVADGQSMTHLGHNAVPLHIVDCYGREQEVGIRFIFSRFLWRNVPLTTSHIYLSVRGAQSARELVPEIATSCSRRGTSAEG